MPQSIIIIIGVTIAGIIVGVLTEALHDYLDDRQER